MANAKVEQCLDLLEKVKASYSSLDLNVGGLDSLIKN